MAATSDEDVPEALKLAREGQTLEAAGDLAGAEAKYRESLAIDATGRNGIVWYNVGRLVSSRDVPEAEAAFRSALAADPPPNVAEQSWAFLCQLAQQAGDIAEAEKRYREWTEAAPTNPLAWNLFGSFLQTKKDDVEGAEAAYTTSLEHDPKGKKGEVWFNLASVTLERDEAEGKKALRTALESDPDDSLAERVWCLLGQLAEDNDDLEEAEASYRGAAAAVPNSSTVWITLAEFLADTKENYYEAEAAYRGAIGADPTNSDTWVGLGTVLKSGGRREEAQEAVEKALALKPDNPTAWFRLGMILDTDKFDQHEDYQTAMRIFAEYGSKVESKVWEEHDAVMGMLSEKSQEDLTGAEAAYRKAIELQPTYVEAWYNLGLLLEKKKEDLSGAEAAFRGAMAADATDPDAWRKVAEIQATQGDAAGAEATLRKGLDANPESPEMWRQLADLLENEGREDEARDAREKADEIEPEEDEDEDEDDGEEVDLLDMDRREVLALAKSGALTDEQITLLMAQNVI